MALRFSITSLVAAMALLAPSLGVAEDLFSLLEPEAFDAIQAEAPPAPVAIASPLEPSEVVLIADEADEIAGLVVTQALELIPPPRLGDESEAEAYLVEEKPSTDVAARRQPAPIAIGLTRPIGGLTVDAGADAELVEQMGRVPDNFAIRDASLDRFGSWYAPTSEVTRTPPRYGATGFHFAAPAVYTRPLYFEQPNLERYGHYHAVCEGDNLTQSAISAAHFFATIPVLPYKIGAKHPGECNYVLGAYRPGSCNPHQFIKPELSVGGAVAQGAAVTGLIFLIP